MKLLKQLFDFYLDASIHVALAVVSLYLISLKILEVSTNQILVGFLFFSTIVCYNFIKYGVEAKKYLIVSNPYHRLIQVLSFLSFLLALYFFLKLDSTIWIATLVLVILSGLYAIPLLPQTKNLRNLGGLKIYLVALVWMGCTVVLTVVDTKLKFTFDVFILMLQRILLVLVLLIPFEIRDLLYDEVNLRTLPQRIGVPNTKIAGCFLVIFYLSLLLFKKEWKIVEVISKLLFGAILLATIKLTKEKQPKYFASFWVEALPMLYLAIWITVEDVF